MNVPRARIWHKGVQRDYHPKPSLFYYGTRNRFLMLAKHDAPLLARIGAWGQTIRTLTSWTVKPKFRFKHEQRDAMWLGLKDYLRHRWGQMPSKQRNQ